MEMRRIGRVNAFQSVFGERPCRANVFEMDRVPEAIKARQFFESVPDYSLDLATCPVRHTHHPMNMASLALWMLMDGICVKASELAPL